MEMLINLRLLIHPIQLQNNNNLYYLYTLAYKVELNAHLTNNPPACPHSKSGHLSSDVYQLQFFADINYAKLLTGF